MADAAALDERPRQVEMGMPVHALDPPAVKEMPPVEVQATPFIAKLGTCIPLLGWFGTIKCVPPNTHMVVIHCGQVTRILAEPGIHCVWGCNETQNMNMMTNVLEVPKANSGVLKVVDRGGSPLVVSCIINYRVVDSTKALFAVNNVHNYVSKNASAVLKRVVATHTYNELKANVDEVNANMMQEVQPLMTPAGVLVASMVINEMNYATEIASAMLKKQQAGALIEARELIVDGAVKIAQDAIRKLEDGGELQMRDEDKVRIVTNLLTVTCSDRDAHPTVPMG